MPLEGRVAAGGLMCERSVLAWRGYISGASEPEPQFVPGVFGDVGAHAHVLTPPPSSLKGLC